MWGEIEPPVKAREESRSESEDRSRGPEEPATPPRICDLYRRADAERPQPPPAELPALSRAESSCVSSMVEAVARGGSLVKSQQVGDEELTLDQRRDELMLQYHNKPLVFLERYHTCLQPEHLSAFARVCADPRAQHYSRVVERRAAGCLNRTRVRNHRYAALRALQKEGEYFSDEQMRMREPLLYEQYIGQYLTDQEVLERSQEAMLDGAPGGPEGPGAPAGATGGLANLLLNSYQERLIQSRLQEEQEEEEGAEEEEEEEEGDGGDRVQPEGAELAAEEKSLLREEFISQMHQRFLDGKDKDFNYSEVDENPDYDNLDIVSRDAEDKYFDDDDDDEEEFDEEEEEEEEEEEDMEE